VLENFILTLIITVLTVMCWAVHGKPKHRISSAAESSNGDNSRMELKQKDSVMIDLDETKDNILVKENDKTKKIDPLLAKNIRAALKDTPTDKSKLRTGSARPYRVKGSLLDSDDYKAHKRRVLTEEEDDEIVTEDGILKGPLF